MPSVAFCQTPVVGGYVSGQTWTAAGSPYVVYGDVRIPAGGYLNIDPGTVIAFMDTDLLGGGLDPTRVEFVVEPNATLTVFGSPANAVEFRGYTGGGPGVWSGIVIESTMTNSFLGYVNISDAVTAVRVDQNLATLYLQDVDISASDTDLDLAPGATVRIDGTLSASRINGRLELADFGTFRLNEQDGVLNGELALLAGSTYEAALRSLFSTDRLSVNGSVELGGSLLLDLSGLQIFPGTWVYLFENDGTDAVAGTFAGLPEGSVWADGGHSLGISYRGGTGNDVTLTVDPAPWPADAEWQPLVDRPSDAFAVLTDPAGDASGALVFDLVGDASDPVAFFAADAEYYFLRARLADTPLVDPLHYATLVVRFLLEYDFVGSPVSYDYAVTFSGSDEMVTVGRNTDEIADWCQDPPEEDVLTYGTPPRTFGDVRITPAGTSLGGGEDHFLDLRLVLREWDTSIGPPPWAATRIVVATGPNTGAVDSDTAILECWQNWSEGVGDVPGSVTESAVLHQNAPNPFNPRTSIRFDLPREDVVSLFVHDLAGRLVCTLVSAEPLPPGSHVRAWDGRDDRGRPVAAGSYFCRLVTGGRSVTKRMTLVK